MAARIKPPVPGEGDIPFQGPGLAIEITAFFKSLPRLRYDSRPQSGYLFLIIKVRRVQDRQKED